MELSQLGPRDFFGLPADWVFGDNNGDRPCSPVIDRILAKPIGTYEETRMAIHRAIVKGLKKFDATGAFTEKLPRDEMVLTLWENDRRTRIG